MKSFQSITIRPGAQGPDFSKTQKTFNSLIKQIEKRRAMLCAWEDVQPKIQKKYLDELLPLVKQSTEMETRLVRALDQAYGLKGLNKTERRKLSEIIVELAGKLAMDTDDTELKDLYNRHSGSNFDDEIEAETANMKQAMAEIFGVDMGPVNNEAFVDELAERLHKHFQRQLQAEQAAAKAQEERKARRKKSIAQLAAEERKRADREQLTLSIREIYRKLVRALHPDRETNAAERARKTSLLTRVNQAYEKNDLLTLLELQLELEHIDQAFIDNTSEERLKRYNKILKEQIGELDREIMQVDLRFRDQYNLSARGRLSPQTALASLTASIKVIKQQLQYTVAAIHACSDIKQVKAHLNPWHLKFVASVDNTAFDAFMKDLSF